jgi:hypothetical protein
MQTVGGGRDTAADAADPHWCAIAIGDDDVLERLGLDNLVIGLEGQASEDPSHTRRCSYQETG